MSKFIYYIKNHETDKLSGPWTRPGLRCHLRSRENSWNNYRRTLHTILCYKLQEVGEPLTIDEMLEKGGKCEQIEHHAHG